MIGARVSARPKLVEPTGFDSPARADLALAIAARNATADSFADLQRAKERIEANAWPMKAAVRAAEEGIETAIQAASAYLIATAAGATPNPPQTIKAARMVLQDAEDGLAAATLAKGDVASRCGQAGVDLDRANRRVHAAAVAVIAQSGSVASFTADLQRLQRELIDVESVFLWMMRVEAMAVVKEHGNRYGLPLDKAALRAARLLDVAPTAWDDLVAAMPGERLWKAALAALELDAATPLPSDA